MTRMLLLLHRVQRWKVGRRAALRVPATRQTAPVKKRSAGVPRSVEMKKMVMVLAMMLYADGVSYTLALARQSRGWQRCETHCPT